MKLEFEFTKKSIKQIKKLPESVKISLQDWLNRVKNEGLVETRKVSGYHDEPCYDPRKNQRSVRLNKAWRVFYISKIEARNKNRKKFKVQIMTIVEVNKHKY